ncbi:MAG: AAA family ATPase [Candidatus Cyclonatronum sp.]|uniref:AAA family ATPase n=1 Tax=Cyclonatronum sp. TaxID=3024185 RepID=UPI0025BAC5EF|nr:AAA family ATPase [Cyclonatronum sp.]MCH8488027.1 AAA family ATPase [Cyclonatronum sp.]
MKKAAPKKPSHIRPKHLTRYYIDHGSHIAFPNQLAYEVFPPGLYFPDTDREGNFLLKRIDPFKQQALMELYSSEREDFDDDDDNDNDDNFSAAEYAAELLGQPDNLDLINDTQHLMDQMDELGEFDELEEMFASLERDYENENESATSKFAASLKRLNRIEGSHYLSEGYFHLEHYNPGLKKAHEAINEFLANEDIYIRNRLGYRRSILLFGEPGTGKSRFIDYTCKRLIDQHQAVVIRLDGRNHIDQVMDHGLIPLEAHLSDRLKVFVIEELAEVVNRHSMSTVLNFLDNAILRNNVIFLMTTNTPERIPANLTNRPSRIDVLEEVGTNNLPGFEEAWYQHITGELLPETEKSQDWYSAKLTPAYLKELFLMCKLKGISPHESFKLLRSRITLVRNSFAATREVGFI